MRAASLKKVTSLHVYHTNALRIMTSDVEVASSIQSCCDTRIELTCSTQEMEVFPVIYDIRKENLFRTCSPHRGVKIAKGVSGISVVSEGALATVRYQPIKGRPLERTVTCFCRMLADEA